MYKSIWAVLADTFYEMYTWNIIISFTSTFKNKMSFFFLIYAYMSLLSTTFNFHMPT